jgi:endonuclease-3
MSFKTHPSAFNANVTLYEPVHDSSAPPDPKREVDANGPAPRKRQKTDASSPRKVVKRERAPKKPKAIPQALLTPHPAPEKWREVYDTIKEMRSRMTAPVDKMGCDQAQHKESDPKVRLHLTLV